ncbi:DUF11 domain-containing protein [Tautonia sociabilis]|nr:DUF11 domain-containing protein [Tautonia sociabilis]
MPDDPAGDPRISELTLPEDEGDPLGGITPPFPSPMDEDLGPPGVPGTAPIGGDPVFAAESGAIPPEAIGDDPAPVVDAANLGTSSPYNEADVATDPGSGALDGSPSEPIFASEPPAATPPTAPAVASEPNSLEPEPAANPMPPAVSSSRPRMALPTPVPLTPEFSAAGGPAADPRLQTSAAPPAGEATMADSLADRLPEGPRVVGLSLDVSQPPTSNINLPMDVVITLRNEGRDDAFDVLVRLPLPDGLEYVESSPPPDEQAPDGSSLSWRWASLPAGESRVIELTTTPRKAVPMDIVPRITSVMAAKSRTAVQEPKLKIDLVGPNGEVLKGSQFDFQVTVSNRGNGPARNVNLQANLTGGLQGYDLDGRLVDDRTFEMAIGTLEPNDVYGPIPLSVLAAGAGEQLCTIRATSPDVVPDTPAEEKKVNIVMPDLLLTVVGPDSRPVGSVAEYVITITNQGTAAATDVIVGFFAPESGTPDVPRDADYKQDPASRHHKIYWHLPRLDKGETREFRVPIRLDRIALYPVQVAAHSQGFTSEQDTRRGSKQTDVVGIPDVQIVSVTRKDPVIDFGDTTDFEIRIRNGGSKEATNVYVDFYTNEWIAVERTDPPDAKYDGNNPTHHGFPPIDRLAPGAERTFVVTVKAVKSPPAGRAVANFDVKIFWDGLDQATPVSSNNYVWIAEGQIARTPGGSPR